MPTPEIVPQLALIGAGYWGKNLARNFHALGALHTLCDRDPAILAGYGPEYAGVNRTEDTEQVWSNPAITAVAIAAPAVLHHRLALRALQAGKDVFVEKPLCLDEKEGAELAAQAEQSGRVLMVGHLLHYHPCVRKLQAMVAQGELGRIHYITSNRLNLGKIRREENALWSFAPHDISVILSLMGNQIPEQVRCMGGPYLTQGVADTTLTALRFAGGARAHVHVSWLNPFKEQKLTVVGSNAMAVFDDTRPAGQKLIVHRQPLTWSETGVPTPAKAAGEAVEVADSEPLRNECAHFLDCCRTRARPRTDAPEGLRVLQVLRMAQTSLERDGEAVTPASRVPVPRAYSAHPTACMDEGCTVGAGTKIWHFSHVLKGAVIGARCVLGQNVNVDGGAVIGDNVKIQNNVSVYAGTTIEDDVFLGPSCVLTNVTNPRSQVNRHSLYEQTRIRRGATIGANATIVCGVTLGRYCFVAAGAVVSQDVPDYALVMGNPARQRGWMSRLGHRLVPSGPEGHLVCPESGHRYQETAPGVLRNLDLDEEAPLPEALRTGTRTYDAFKADA